MEPVFARVEWSDGCLVKEETEHIGQGFKSKKSSCAATEEDNQERGREERWKGDLQMGTAAGPVTNTDSSSAWCL